jgi:hypothetical protein
VDTQARVDEILQELEEERQHVHESLRRLAVVAAYLRALLPMHRRSVDGAGP